ncbi:MAG: hypothetical protein ACRCYY_02590 [Trueperaceae bacterium]
MNPYSFRTFIAPTLTLFLSVFFSACTPVNQTVKTVTNFVEGTHVVRYYATPEELATVIQESTPAMSLHNGYTPLRVTDIENHRITVFAQALKGSNDFNVKADDFAVYFTLTEQDDYTEATISPSSSSNDTARIAVTDYVAKLDSQFARYAK